MPTVRQLEYLVAIADVRHFRRAAVKVNTTQPTLSGQLKALEDRLGVELVERSRSRVALTPAGSEIVEIARRILRDVREIRAVSSSHDKKLAGVVRLGVPSSIGPSLVPRLTQDLRREYPDLKFFVREEHPLQLPNALADGTYDIAIGPLPFASGDFETVTLYDEPLQLALPSNHALAKKTEVSPADLRGLGILALEPGHPLAVLVGNYCGTVGAFILRDYPGNTLDTLREMVGTGLGPAFMPSLYVKSSMTKDRTIKIVEVTGRPLVRQVGIAWRKSGAHKSRYADLGAFLKVTADKVVGPL